MLSKKQSGVRPHSSITTTSRKKQYRFNDNEELNTITSDIHKAFNRENRFWNEIKQLTHHRVDKKYQKNIDHLCVKYSIIPIHRKTQWINNRIDVDFLVKNYLRGKSKQEERKKSQVDLKKQIRSITSRYQKKRNKPFFTISRENLLSISQTITKDNKQASKQKHPFMSYYEQQQRQALISITEGNPLQLTLQHDYPPMTEMEEWERDHLNKKAIYSGVSDFRWKAKNTRSKRYSQSQLNQFFITG